MTATEERPTSSAMDVYECKLKARAQELGAI